VAEGVELRDRHLARVATDKVAVVSRRLLERLQLPQAGAVVVLGGFFVRDHAAVKWQRYYASQETETRSV
jgi:limonene-1,2-epoxide hydrolase